MSEGQKLAALVVFGLTYWVILAGEKPPRKLDRPAAGLLGGIGMVACGVLTRTEAERAIDLATIGLLLGMMIVIHFATESGLLDAMAHFLIDRSRGATHLLWMVCGAAGILSALFVNDTVCLLMTPLLLTATRRAKLPPEPYLIALATSSNAGSVMTLTGNPQNMLIGQSSGMGWGAFALRMVPVGLVCLAINGWIVSLLYRKTLRCGKNAEENEEYLGEEARGKADTEERKRRGETGDADGKMLDRRLANKTGIVLAGLLIAFLAGVPMEIAALAAGGLLLIWANRPAEEAFGAVDWGLLLFFAGLFVVVEGVTKTQGAIIGRIVPMVTQHPGSLMQLSGLSVASIVGSNIFSNVPFVMLLRGWIVALPHAGLLWLMLAASSTLAGNLTLVGSVANLIVAQKAKEECPLGFGAFLRVGVATTLATTLVSILLLWLYGKLGWA